MAGRQRGNGSGSVSTLKDSKGKVKYRVRVTLGTYYDEESGKVKTISKSLGVFSRKADAEAALVEFNNSPYDLDAKIKTVGDLYEAWSKDYFEGLSDSSKRTVTSAWGYCKDIKNMPLRKLNIGHIKDVMEKGYVIVSRGTHKGEKRYASVNTKLRIKSIFNLMLDYAREHNLVTNNVARAFDVNDMRKQADYQKKVKSAFSQEDINLLWDNLEEFPYIDIILIGIYTGFRPSELCELKLSNVFLDENKIVGGMKTEAGTDRQVPIHPLIKPLVERRYNQAVKYNSEWLFNDRHSQTGMNITYDKFRHKFEAIMVELGISGITGHCVRVTFTTKCYKAGIPEYIIKRVVGHSLKNNVTDAVYNRVSFDDLYEAVCKIER